MEGIVAECLIADRGYDSDAIIEQAVKQGMKPVIPPRKNRTKQRPYDEHLYKLRHLVENTFLHLKRWGTLPPDTPKTASFLAAIQIRCIALWLKVS
jgi:transposase